MYLETPKNKRWMRFASALVAVVLAFGLMPLPAFAQAEGGGAAVPLVAGDSGAAFLAGESDGPTAEIDAYWPNFRNSENNMAIVDVKTPIYPTSTKLMWAKVFNGGGYANAPSPQLIVDNALVATCDKIIYKLDMKTGAILAQGGMADETKWGITPMTYAEGMIFVPISGGIQAFDAKTLESKWVYKDPKSGSQALSQIVYSDGYLYTGFWISETAEANYVCVSVADEDPNNPTEAKAATWTDSHLGGFYWAGGVAVGDYIIVGSDNGMKDDGTDVTPRDAKLRAYKKPTETTGTTVTLASSIDLTDMGDQRSSIAWDASRNRVFFTTKAGFIASAAFDPSTGQLSDLKSCNTGMECTGTPIVYEGVVYVGMGAGLGGAGNFVACKADTMELLYTKELKGYPQASLLLSTAYETERNSLLFYSTYNDNPGGLQMIMVRAGATTADKVVVSDIYIPEKKYQQQCISSPIAGPDGTIYYKNDSGAILAVRTNTAPVLADSVGASSAEATVEAGTAYNLDLAPLFTDADGDALAYTVEIDGAAAVPANAAYSYVPSAAGTKKLVFRAKDGAESSASSYTVTLKVTAKQGAGDDDPSGQDPSGKDASGQNPSGKADSGKNDEEKAAAKIAADKKAAATVSALIAKLPAANKATALDKAAADKAKKAYDALTAAQKAYVSKANVTKLNAVKKAADNEHKNGLAKGKTFKMATGQGTFAYKVTAKKKVTLTEASATKKNGTVAVNAVKYHGVSYKVVGIGAKAFKSSKLKKVTLGNNVTTIGAQAFADCASLTTLTVGKNVKKLGASAFAKTPKLKKLTVKSAKLNSKSKVKNALKGSSVKTVKLAGLTKAQKKKVASALASAGKKGLAIK